MSSAGADTAAEKWDHSQWHSSTRARHNILHLHNQYEKGSFEEDSSMHFHPDK